MPKHPLFDLIKNEPLFHSLVEKYGTPLYVYSKDRLIHNIQTLDQALGDHFESHHICYTIKANSNPHLIQALKSTIPALGADCASPGEIAISGKCGIVGNECIYTGNYESPNDLSYALETGAHINLDDISSFHRLKRIGLPKDISFRLNPGFGRGAFSQVVTGGENSKFGVPHYDIVNAYRLAKESGITSFGIQCMTGSGVLDPNYYPNLISKILKTVKKLKDELNIHMDYISLGGGYGIPYTDEDSPLNFDNVFNNVAQNFNVFFESRHEAKPALWIEPGKSVVGDTGILLTRVTGKKDSYKSYIGVDAGMETLMRPALYGAYHRIYKVGDPDALPSTKVDITGRICENTDRLAKDRLFPEVNEGDLLAVMDAGAYGFTMSNQFCTRPKVAEIFLAGEKPTLIRRRETIKDILRSCDV
ncbi:MAG: diaminopimelate decarboxylase [Candidatus Marinimicrobia bacterium]|jgi:diaminopimelate decarboxylase|nr:diaminopimelate decarboxylase [Candidatus Neomarinimicrobiota bacterium]MBT3936318.1 diaminopimelate decarboxylase [Candidatus Neomarinimicrobiota bacterium]MBT3960270.1 diaminopimelate decarboxylase [Candidatus Neomarinimicrobiota bacterium]MBT4383358.1 diaminopimelate decarboxylase [Candidatus Neomarinimicrobiota bacterium]MBT4635371.1 diaminopimelate decarboxylase [Candidatus Neomarinimicrobiota bacterium]